MRGGTKNWARTRIHGIGGWTKINMPVNDILSISPPLEMSRLQKDFLRKDGCLYKLGTPGRGDIFVENRIVNRITHSVGEIVF